MQDRMKTLARNVATWYPIYRLMPTGSLRTYAELRYRNATSSRREVTEAARHGRASRHLSTGLIAAKAAFRTGQDDVVDELLGDLVSRFPHAAAVYELRAELRECRGQYDDALADAERAQLLEPARATATSKAVRLTYRVRRREQADEIALAALRRMPLHQSVLWAVCKCCSSAEQAQRIVATWHEAVGDKQKLPQAVWQLATALARGRLAEEACQLYRDAIVALHQNPGSVEAVPPRVLEGKGAWSAIADITDVLDKAEIPFFFAAGTALGLVREGRPLALDGDIDVGVFESDWDRDAFIDLFRHDPRFTLDPNPMSKKVGLKHRGGSPIDIFRYYEEGGKVWHDGVFVRWDNSPFVVERREINGLKLPVPEDADVYLTENYGDWRVPNPGYDVFTEAPNFHVHWPEYAHMHLLRRAFRALRSGERSDAIADLTTAGESALATLLGDRSRRGVSHGPPASSRSEETVLPTVEDVLSRSRALVVDGQRGAARAELISAIRDKDGIQSPLWIELASLVRDSDDYQQVRALWLSAPQSVHNELPIVRAVAEAGRAGGVDDDAIVLARKAIHLSLQQNSRVHAVAGRVRSALRPPGTSRSEQGSNERQRVDGGGPRSEPYLELLTAIVEGGEKRDPINRLQAMGEVEWLDSLKLG
jgi:tetratricopeptide (TPR) repeat protein